MMTLDLSTIYNDADEAATDALHELVTMMMMNLSTIELDDY